MNARSGSEAVEVAVVGAGSVGIAVAYYLLTQHRLTSIAIIDSGAPLGLASAVSGENYRNWWPHPVMTAFTDRSISLLESIDAATAGRLAMTRGGYALVTREDPEPLIESLFRGYGDGAGRIRVHDSPGSRYQLPQRDRWQDAPDGVDVLLEPARIRSAFPGLAGGVSAVLHIRRAGSISAQQLGQHMLEVLRAAGVRVLRAEVHGIEPGHPFVLHMDGATGPRQLRAGQLVNAAGQYLADIAGMLGERLPVRCVYQQKLALPDRECAIARDLPFTIDLDGQTLAWSAEERELLAADPATVALTEPMAGGSHCRPEGPAAGTWIKLGWAYNRKATDPHGAEPQDPHFPDIVLRAASRLHPRLSVYLGRLPRGARHYGGYYTMTEENLPLVGPSSVPGAFVAGALSGFGSMAACATGELCAAWVSGSPLPDYAGTLSSGRYADAALMAELTRAGTGSL